MTFGDTIKLYGQNSVLASGAEAWVILPLPISDTLFFAALNSNTQSVCPGEFDKQAPEGLCWIGSLCDGQWIYT